MAEQMKQHKAGEMAAKQTIPAGYKQTEVGVIPEDWDVLPLNKVANFKNGVAHEDCVCESGEYVLVNSKFISSEGLSEKMSRDCRQPAVENDILMVMSDVPNGKAIAKCYLVNASGRYTVNQRICILSSQLVNSKYLFYKLNRNPFYLSFDDGAKQTNLRRQDVLDCLLAIPAEAEQTAIANVLSDSDALIDALEQLVAKKQAIKTAAMQQLLTGRTRLPQFALRPDGTPKGYKSSELGQIPEDWEVVSLGDASQFINGRAYALHKWESSGVPVIRLQNLTGRGDEYYYSNLQLPERQYCDFGDLLFMWSATFGPVIWKGSKAIYHYHIWKIECKGGNNKTFLFYLLGDMTERLKNNSSSGGTMLHVTKEKMESTKTISPSVEEQTAISNVLSDMDSELNALEQKLAKARDLKQGMMQQLLTGRIRLPLEVVA